MSINQQLGVTVFVFMLGSTAFLLLTSSTVSVRQFALRRFWRGGGFTKFIQVGLPSALIGGALAAMFVSFAANKTDIFEKFLAKSHTTISR